MSDESGSPYDGFGENTYMRALQTFFGTDVNDMLKKTPLSYVNALYKPEMTAQAIANRLHKRIEAHYNSDGVLVLPEKFVEFTDATLPPMIGTDNLAVNVDSMIYSRVSGYSTAATVEGKMIPYREVIAYYAFNRINQAVIIITHYQEIDEAFFDPTRNGGLTSKAYWAFKELMDWFFDFYKLLEKEPAVETV